jgi:DNA-binding transcriptional LysR family regulator
MQLNDRIGRRIKLQDLHVLMTVVEAGSMGKAAERLHTSQPAVSNSIAKLEHTLGVRLLDRHPQGIEPTRFGRALLDCGVAVFDDLRQGIKNIDYLADPTAGEVRIGCNPLLAADFVPAVIDGVSRRYSRIVFHLATELTDALHDQLNNRTLDLLITRRFGPVADPRLNFEFLFDDPFVVATGTGNRWVGRRKVTLADLLNETWLLPPPESAFGSVAVQAFRASGLDYPHVTLITDSAEVRSRLLPTGRFLTIWAASAVSRRGARSGLRVLPVELPIASQPNGIVTVKDRSLSPVAQVFVQHARTIAKRLLRSA